MKHEVPVHRSRSTTGVMAFCCLLAWMLLSPAVPPEASADVEPGVASPTSVVEMQTSASTSTVHTGEIDRSAPDHTTESRPRAIGEWYALGGWVMHLLVICSALVLGVMAERLWALRSSATVPGRLERALLEKAACHDRAACLELCATRRSMLARVALAIIEGQAVGPDEARERLALVGGYEVRRLHRNLDLLAGLANIATMLGLLGTVLGMISAFGTIAEVGTSDARVVAGGIFEALVTTAAGLVIGVTALACHTHLVRRVDGITTRIEVVAATLIDGANPEPDTAREAREPRTARLVTQAN